jgi:arylsulfatase A-like enzyme/Tfp pilus assembly protein PilF
LRRPASTTLVFLSLAVAAGLALLPLLCSPHPNLVLITIDTLRADHVGVYGDAAAETPTLDALARRGVRFARARSAAPLTGPSHATILTGVYPPQHGVRDNVNFVLDNRHPTLAGLLKEKGYRTAAFVGAYPLASAFGFGRGFERFGEGFHETAALGQGAERPGNEVADAALEWLASTGRDPFFVWIHLYDPHAPYTPPAPYAERFRDRPYDGEIAFADAQVGRVLEALRTSRRDANTLVVVLSDHGEGLGEHGEATHGMLVYDSTLHVPWIMAGPGVPAGRVVADEVGTVDVLPTLLGLVHASPPSGLPGRDLRPALAERSVRSEPLYAESLFGRLNCRWSALRSWTSGGLKLIEGSEPELYDLANDPGELVNRASAEPDKVARLRGTLRSAVARMAPPGDSAKAVALSPEQEEKLRSLGYAAGSGGAGALDEPGLPDPRTHVGMFERLQRALIAQGPAVLPALAEASALASEDPDNPFAHFTRASLAYRAGRLDVAAESFARALAIDPDRPGMRHYYGRLLREKGDLVESERQLRLAVAQTGDDDLRTRVNLADTLVVQGKLDEAEALLRPALAKEPDHLEAQAALGRLFMARHRPADALPFLQAATRGAGAEPWIELASVYLELNDAGKAESAAQEALRRSPMHPWALALQGHVLIREGRRDAGLAALHEALRIHPRRPEVWQSLARAFAAAGDRETAAACRREAERRG